MELKVPKRTSTVDAAALFVANGHVGLRLRASGFGVGMPGWSDWCGCCRTRTAVGK
ncbi:uncharacterized protein BDZ83DRAFT_605117 [Colletotrichum acutatum]|uniref:Uncharacterized protein n=1 Tax=Glomerella acutata TaxID=27357 RepID=A0AAD8XL89_GLOAC|nr:uncharacterized protein BDZ83DRAFT_605117 [Colletotrichum acutatum]KAK1729450.1 hypothetical protein BDZ83DRAFT_605117 [Colletotrichum acutatum]